MVGADPAMFSTGGRAGECLATATAAFPWHFFILAAAVLVDFSQSGTVLSLWSSGMGGGGDGAASRSLIASD